ncbi:MULTISPECIES: restriction endonuclease subunit S [Acinetobacter]|uniref:restriction endonuclease subunit S n=1 Tax=Acinetobacter TaxID=469 RepID=UPI00257D7473|nr:MULTISPECIES: restriction endonuclease subunit S [Acinetobacter]
MAKYQAYAEYKDSGVEWLGEIPCHWDLKPIKYLFEIINGSTPKSGEETFWDGEITWITPSDLSKLRSQVIGESIRTITKKGLDSCGTSLVPSDTIILSCRAPIGSLAVTSKEACTNQGCKSLVKKYDLSTKFFYYYLSISTKQLNNLGRGTTFLELSSDELGSYALGIPNAEEQTQIANFLDHETAKIDNLIQQQQQLIELLKEKRQAVISHAVTKGLDPNVPMKDSGVEWLGEVPEHWIVAGFKKYLSSIVDYRGKTPEKVDEGIFLVTARNIKKGKIDYSLSQEYVSDNDYDQIMSRGSPLIGDVLFTTEAPLGEVSQVDRTDIALAQRIIKFRGQDNVLDNTFLKFFMMSTSFQDSLMTFASGSTALGIKAERLGYLKQLIPPLNEQQEIVKHIEKCVHQFDGLEKKMRDAISLMQERRTALISAAVTGKIDVRHWQSPTVAEADTELSA